MRTIVLMGFMGAGKSEVGRRLARRLGRDFFDTDRLIEERAGKSVSSIFAEDGEVTFRAMERDVVRDVATRAGAVIAVGGGAVVDPVNARALRGTGSLVVHLTADLETTLSRIGDAADRPLLTDDPRAAIARLQAERRPFYEAAADVTVDTSSRSADDIVDEIRVLAERHGTPPPADVTVDVVEVDLGERAYPIYVGAACLAQLGARVVATGCGARVAVVTTETVAGLYLESALASLRAAGLDPAVIRIPDGEEQKNITQLARIYDELIAAGVDRGGAVVALGGGVLGDLSGFAAATYLRGITCVQVPTTLVAQVDSSVGGKTGINHSAGKNLIGAFAQPRFVLADVECLRSLPVREYKAGLAEVIKYGVILDPALFELLERERDAVERLDRDVLIEIVRTSCRLKADVVVEDEKEGGFRAVLNFGHTIGHAVESLTGYTTLLHGEGVAIGMVAAERVSECLGLCSAEVGARIRNLIERYGLPTTIPTELTDAALAHAMQTDKKARGGTIKFVCTNGIGSASFQRLSAEEIVKHVRG